ncbi:hypothetical protein NCY60_08350, partial [Bacteroides uniformis]|uniref:hypothetical protein n=1 Tax=Bacteroides uniformis TaxID=820 RepID=UPI002030F0EE
LIEIVGLCTTVSIVDSYNHVSTMDVGCKKFDSFHFLSKDSGPCARTEFLRRGIARNNSSSFFCKDKSVS